MEKTNLTNFQRIFLDEKNASCTTDRNSYENGHQTASVFEVIHSLAPADVATMNDVNKSDHTLVQLKDFTGSTSAPIPTVCNPLLLAIPSFDQTMRHGFSYDSHKLSDASHSLYEREFNSSMHINRMFDEIHEQVRNSFIVLYFFLKKILLRELIDSY